MKKFFMVVLTIMLVVAGTGYINSKAAHAGDAADSDAKSGGYGEFVELSPLILPIIGTNGVSQTVSLVVAIEVQSSSDAKKIESIAPRLQDAYIQDMYGVLSSQANLNAGGVIQVKQLKERLRNVSRVVAGDIVSDVLLQVVSQQPI